MDSHCIEIIHIDCILEQIHWEPNFQFFNSLKLEKELLINHLLT